MGSDFGAGTVVSVQLSVVERFTPEQPYSLPFLSTLPSLVVKLFGTCDLLPPPIYKRTLHSALQTNCLLDGFLWLYDLGDILPLLTF